MVKDDSAAFRARIGERPTLPDPKSSFEIRPLTPKDIELARTILINEWGSARVVSRGRLFNAEISPGFLAITDNKPSGMITYNIEGGACEVITLSSSIENVGIGSSLISAVRQKAVAAGCRRLWLITTNDNTHALRFYQRHDFIIAAVHVNSIVESRKLKPEIPKYGHDGIPIRDEIELEMHL
jgi:ribosomal protein S18 acetylase RimI-like enzyme